jgi:hypothetical protein
VAERTGPGIGHVSGAQGSRWTIWTICYAHGGVVGARRTSLGLGRTRRTLSGSRTGIATDPIDGIRMGGSSGASLRTK